MADPDIQPSGAPETPPVEDDDLDAAIGAALDRIEHLDEGDGEDVSPSDDGRARDEHGRFTRREPDGAAGLPPTGPPTADLEFPEHWSEARRSTILALPAEHRESVFSQWREAETQISNWHRELAAQRQAIEPLLGVLEPLRPQLAAQGIAPETALANFLGALQRFRANPEQALFEMAETVARQGAGPSSARDMLRRLSSTLGVDSGAMPDEASSADEWLDPRAAREVTALRSQLLGLQQQVSTFQQGQQRSAWDSAMSEATGFAQARAADGTPAHPYFDHVRGAMARIIGAGAAQDLATAYEMATWSDPGIRQQLLEAERRSVSNGHEAARKAAVAKAKAATAPSGGRSRPGGLSPAEDQTLDDALGSAVDRIMEQYAA